MIQIYSPQINARIEYAFTQVLQGFMGIPVAFTDDLSGFLTNKNAKIAYCSDEIINYDGLWIQASKLLFEKGISNQAIQIETYQNIPCFYKCLEKSLIPFDWFAASFYLLTRYEEFQNLKARDQHQRFIAEESIAIKEHFLHIPVIDYWCLFIQEILQKNIPELRFKKQHASLSLSVDIDHFYAYQYKPIIENIGRIGLSMIKGNWSTVKQIVNVTFFNQKDPFDYFDQWEHLMTKKAQESLFFVYCGKKGPNDPEFKEYPAILRKLKNLTTYAQIGIHPSYKAFENPTQSKKEIELLELHTQQLITKSRQHFIRLSIPKTYETLLDIGIKDDYTMGYPTNMGFRAGTAQEFYFYSLEKESPSNLVVHPFQITDIALFLSKNETQAMQIAWEIMMHVQKTKQKLCILCHSHALDDRMDNTDYFKTLETLIDEYSGTTK